jgi:hypothetical protein
VANGINDNVPWSLVVFSDGVQRLALVNSTTYDFRILATGVASGARISKTGKFAAWYVNSAAVGGFLASSTVFFYEIATAQLTAVPLLNAPSAMTAQQVGRLEFSSDETALFLVRTGIPALTRIKLGSPGNPDTFPGVGVAATQIANTSNDRWFVRDSSNAVRLVTPSMDYPSVFTNVTTFSATPTAWAFTNCAINCDLYVLGPTSTSPALRDSSIAIPSGTYLNFTSYNLDNRADYPCFTNGTNAFCVHSTDASHIALAAHPTNFKLNEAGDRVIWTLPSGANSAMREEAMPPQTSTTNRASNTAGWNVGWISPTRAFAVEGAGAMPRNLHLFQAGTATMDSDIGQQGVVVSPPLLVVPKQSVSQWRAYLGDGAERSIPVATNLPVAFVSVRAMSGGSMPAGLTRYAGLSFDWTTSFLIDETTGMVRQTSYGFTGGPAYRSGANEYFDADRLSGGSVWYLFNTNTLIEHNEADVTFTPAAQYSIGAPGVGAWLGLDEDRRTIHVGGFQP